MRHTPAVDSLTNTEKPNQLYRRETPNGTFNTYRTAIIVRSIRQRPISVHSPKTAYGWRDPKGFYARKRSLVAPNCTVKSVDTKNIGYVYTMFDQYLWDVTSMPNLWDTKSVSHLSDAAITSCLKQLKRERVNLGVAFGERKQVVRMFQGTTRTINKQVENYVNKRPADWRKAKRTLPFSVGRLVPGGSLLSRVQEMRKRLPNSYLELTYGWTPLLNDLYGTCQALAEQDVRGNRYHASVRSFSAETDREVQEISYSHFSPKCGYDLISTVHRRVNVRLDYELDNILLQQFSSLGLTNPVAILWELVPYSFVLDWLLPLGGWLSVMDASLGWKFKGGSQSVKRTKYGSGGPFRIIQHSGIFDPTHKVTFARSIADAKLEQEQFERTVFTSSPLPTVPRFRNPFSPRRTANALALLSQALNR